MKKLCIVALAGLFAFGAYAEVTNNVVNIDEVAVAVTVNPTTGTTILTEAENVRTVLAAYGAGTVSTITVDRAQEIWIPIGIAADVANGTESSAIAISYKSADAATLFRLQSITQVGGSETYTPLAGYPSMVYGDKLMLTAASADTTNSYVVTFIKKAIPR